MSYGTARCTIRAFAAALLAAPLAAQAVVITYDITGTGFVDTYTGVGSDTTTVADSFSGTIVLNISGNAPSLTNGTTFAQGLNDGWVTADFAIAWSTGTYVSGPVVNLGGSIVLDVEAQVFNDSGGTSDALYNLFDSFSSSPDGSQIAQNGATLLRGTNDPSWLSGLDYPDRGLAPISGHTNNNLSFVSYTGVYDGTQYNLSGFTGNVTQLDSMVARQATSVPEPSTLALLGLGLGLALLGLARRKR